MIEKLQLGAEGALRKDKDKTIVMLKFYFIFVFWKTSFIFISILPKKMIS